MKMFKNRNYLLYSILVIIFALALFLRVYKLGEFPVGFHQDEASLGYNGYSLMLTGKDDNGNRFPLYVDMFGDNRPSGYHYLTIIPVIFFGLTEFATRFPGAIFGSATIFAIYFLVVAIFKNKSLGLISAFLLAIAPWHLVLSRASAESIVALFFILLGFGLIIHSLRNQKLLFLFSGTLLASFSFFFYHTPRIFVPLFFLSLLLFLFSTLRKYKNNRYKISLIGSFLFLSIMVFILVFFVKGGTGRYNQVNIFSFPETKLVMEEQIRENGIAGTSSLITRIFHNKVVNYSFAFVSNYFEYFSGSFLFIKGGLPIWYNVPGMGLVYVITLPFVIWGVILLAVHKDKIYKIPLIWLLIAPVTAAITTDDIPNINRAVVIFPMIEIIAAYGFLNFINKIRLKLKPIAILLVSVFLLYNFLYFLEQYFVHAPVHRNWYRNEGFGEMVKTIKNSYNNVDRIIVTKSLGGIYPLILFYMGYDPMTYQSEGSPKDKEYSGFGKFFFVPQECPSLQKDDRFPRARRILYVDKGECSTGGMLIYRKDGTRAFRIVYE